MCNARRTFSRLKARLTFPALAVAMGISTLVAGLDRTEYLAKTLVADQAVRITPGVATAGSSVDGPAAEDRTGNTSGLNLDVSDSRITKWVQRFTTSLKGDFTKSLDRMDEYATMMNSKLDKKDMPRELIYLAMIESQFDPTARSKVGAVGMWQFMSATARQLGLTVKGKVDERKDPAEATDAALTYLDQLHDRFGSWYLAAAAYNSGAGTVSKALRKVTGKAQGTDEDFFRILPVLPKETQEYVPRLIASAKVGSDPERYGM